MTDLDIAITVKPFSMTSGSNLMATVQIIRHLDHEAVSGDFVECGVWKGGHVIAAMLAAQKHREYWLFDTFDGMTEPGPWDYRKGQHASLSSKYRKKGIKQWCRAELSEVRHNIDQYCRADQLAHYVQGPVEQTLRGTQLPDKIAFLRLDTDFYNSTKIELEVLWPRLVAGGVMVVDDYLSWDGCRRACDEYFGSHWHYDIIDNKAIKVIKHAS